MTSAPKKQYRVKHAAPVAGRWRKKGAMIELSEREAEAERVWGVIEEVVSKRARRAKRSKPDG